MAKYTTCLECGSVQVDKESSQKVTVFTCADCGNSEEAQNDAHIERGLVYFDKFETLTGAEVKELRA